MDGWRIASWMDKYKIDWLSEKWTGGIWRVDRWVKGRHKSMRRSCMCGSAYLWKLIYRLLENKCQIIISSVWGSSNPRSNITLYSHSASKDINTVRTFSNFDVTKHPSILHILHDYFIGTVAIIWLWPEQNKIQQKRVHILLDILSNIVSAIGRRTTRTCNIIMHQVDLHEMLLSSMSF